MELNITVPILPVKKLELSEEMGDLYEKKSNQFKVACMYLLKNSSLN